MLQPSHVSHCACATQRPLVRRALRSHSSCANGKRVVARTRKDCRRKDATLFRGFYEKDMQTSKKLNKAAVWLSGSSPQCCYRHTRPVATFAPNTKYYVIQRYCEHSLLVTVLLAVHQIRLTYVHSTAKITSALIYFGSVFHAARAPLLSTDNCVPPKVIVAARSLLAPL